MSDHEHLEPLEPELAELFAREQDPSPSLGASARVLGRLAVSIRLPDPAAHDGSLAVRGLSRRALGLAATTFVLGAALGAGVAVAVRPVPVPSVVVVERPVSSGSASVAPPIEHPPSSPSSAPESSKSGHTPPQTGPRSNAPDTLGVERQLVEDARSKLASGDAQGALGRLEEHARRFPRGHLMEEREALAIQALANAGRGRDARARAATFRARWPESVYLVAIEATLASIPVTD
ncbi:MAG: hypothetical protein KF764_19085 [Labilithrix sp.]|nr:hypothetical protein [Labilithrix sp.]MBX3224895.1 hypothetical protein [Labilithrix sp.]